MRMYIQEHYLMQKNIGQRKIQKDKIKRTEKRKEKILITKERAKEHREKITRGESPNPRPVKKGATEGGQYLVVGAFHILKRPPISLPPKTPH